METRANYALVGLFTLVVMLGIFGFIYWIKTFGVETAQKTYYVHFETPVSGLMNGAEVEFNGLKVGSVTELSLNPKDPRQVDARISIGANTPVKTDTKGSLKIGGITGVAWVALEGGSAEAPPLPPGGVINATGSDLQALMQTAQKLSEKADKTFDQLNTALNRVNDLLKNTSPQIESSMKSIEQVTSTLADKNGNFLQALDSIEPAKVRNIVRNADEALAKVNNLLGGEAGKTMIADISSAARSIRKLADSLNRFANAGLPQYQGLAVEGRKTLQDVDRAVKTIERDPQSIIFGRKPTLPAYNGN